MATITKRGQGWFAQVRRKGHPSRSKTFSTKLAASQWAAAQEATVLAALSPSAQVIPRSLTLRAIIERYLEQVTPTKRSQETERYRLRKMLRDSVCEVSVRDLSPAAFAAYRDRRLLEVSAGTIRRELSLLNHMFDVARREWGIPIVSNLVAEVGKPPLRNARTRRLKSGEWPALRKALQESRNPWMLAIVECAIETALRRGEILDLRWSSVNLYARTAFIPRTKTDVPRTIPLTPGAVRALNDLPRSSDIVFPVSENSVKLAWARAKQRAGVPDLRFHDLRHEAITRFFELGLSMPEVALISGHKDARMLFRYTHLRASSLAEKLRTLTAKPASPMLE